MTPFVCVWSKSGVFGECAIGHQVPRVFCAARVKTATEFLHGYKLEWCNHCRRVGTQHLMLGCHLRWMWERKKIQNKPHKIPQKVNFSSLGACFSWTNAPSGGRRVEYKRIEINWEDSHSEGAGMGYSIEPRRNRLAVQNGRLFARVLGISSGS